VFFFDWILKPLEQLALLFTCRLILVGLVVEKLKKRLRNQSHDTRHSLNSSSLTCSNMLLFFDSQVVDRGRCCGI
jgi:hypothetical protein